MQEGERSGTFQRSNKMNGSSRLVVATISKYKRVSMTTKVTFLNKNEYESLLNANCSSRKSSFQTAESASTSFFVCLFLEVFCFKQNYCLWHYKYFEFTCVKVALYWTQHCTLIICLSEAEVLDYFQLKAWWLPQNFFEILPIDLYCYDFSHFRPLFIAQIQNACYLEKLR